MRGEPEKGTRSFQFVFDGFFSGRFSSTCNEAIGAKVITFRREPIGWFRQLAFTLKLITVRPTYTALLYWSRSGVRCLTRTSVPNFDVLSSRRNFPFSSLIFAWHRLTDMSFIRRSLSCPRPSLKTLFWGAGRIMCMIRELFFSCDRLSSTM